MRAVVDQDKCNGAGVCVQALPNVFRFQEGSKKAKVIMAQIPQSFEPKLRQVAEECPANAIIVLMK